MGRNAWTEARTTLMRLLSAEEAILRDNKELLKTAVLPVVGFGLAGLVNSAVKLCIKLWPADVKADVTLHMPANIGDYTDFYASREHASNCGEMFRGKGNELNENWCVATLQRLFCRHATCVSSVPDACRVHIPIAYHGRSSSIVVSGTPVRRPRQALNQSTAYLWCVNLPLTIFTPYAMMYMYGFTTCMQCLALCTLKQLPAPALAAAVLSKLGLHRQGFSSVATAQKVLHATQRTDL